MRARDPCTPRRRHRREVPHGRRRPRTSRTPSVHGRRAPATSRAPSGPSATTTRRRRRSWRARLLTLLAIIGPGAHRHGGRQRRRRGRDLRPGGPELRAQPAVDPAAAHPRPHRQPGDGRAPRRGTGVGHARLINERFGRFWGAFSVGDLFVLNFLTIVTEFIGVSLALGYFGVSAYISVPLAALGLVAMTATGSFRRWERFMFVFVVGQLPRRSRWRSTPTPTPARSSRHFVVPGGARRLQLDRRSCSSSPSSARPSRRGSCSSSSRTSSTSGSPRAGSTTSASTPCSARSSPCWRPA